MKGDFDYLLGTGRDCDIRVRKPGIDPRHARLQRRGDRLFVRDLSQETGVFVNNERIAPGKWHEVTRFDVVRMAAYGIDIGADLFVGRQRLGLETTPLFFQSKDGRTLCDGVYLRASAGSMTAIMGPSGCGKSVFLNVLSGVYQPEQGSVFLGEDRIPLHAELPWVSDFMGYVPQAEVLLPELTVAQSLDFRLRLIHPDMEKAVRKRLIRRVSERLGFTGEALETFLHTRIGAPEEKGRVLSGGQRRRASIAHELITEPLVLFLDEPTSGLSSADADEIVDLLHSLAQRDGITVIATIHQPSRYAFSRFDNLLLMGVGGMPVYYGSRAVAEQVVSHRLAPQQNPAEALLKIATNGESIGHQGSEGIEPLAPDTQSGYESSDSSGLGSAFRKLGRGISQFFTLSRRNLAVLANDHANLWFAALQVPVIAALIFTAFSGAEGDHKGADRFVQTIQLYNQSPDRDSAYRNDADRLRGAISEAGREEGWISESRAQQRATIYFVLGLSAIWFGLLGASREIVGEQAVIAREGRAGIAPGSVICAKFLTHGLVACLQVTGIIALLQPGLLRLSGDALGQLMACLCLTALAAAALGLMLSASVRTYRAVMTIIPVILIPQVLFGGLLRVLQPGSLNEAAGYATLSRWAFELTLRVDPNAQAGVLRIDTPTQPSDDIIGIHQIIEHLVSLSQTGLSKIYFTGSQAPTPVIVLSAMALLFLITARVLVRIRQKV